MWKLFLYIMAINVLKNSIIQLLIYLFTALASARHDYKISHSIIAYTGGIFLILSEFSCFNRIPLCVRNNCRTKYAAIGLKSLGVRCETETPSYTACRCKRDNRFEQRDVLNNATLYQTDIFVFGHPSILQ